MKRRRLFPTALLFVVFIFIHFKSRTVFASDEKDCSQSSSTLRCPVQQDGQDDRVFYHHQSQTASRKTTQTYYTVHDDASYAIRSANISSSLLGEQPRQLHARMIQGCQRQQSILNMQNNSTTLVDRCIQQDNYRMYQNHHQPSSMKNFTNQGFTKIQCPQQLWNALQDFWNSHSHYSEPERETHTPTTFHNDFESPTYYMDIFHNVDIVAKVYDTIRPMLEDWMQVQRLVPASLYGIRIYHSHAILAPHVDRLPLVASAIINIAQSVHEDWPLEVYDHEGVAHNVTMQPGDIVLYESHSIVHGRPFPLQGEFFANLFVHFEVVEENEGDHDTQLRTNSTPPYLIHNSYWHNHVWKNENPDGWALFQTAVEIIGRGGNLEDLQMVGRVNPDALWAVDPKGNKKGWRPIHEVCLQGKPDMLIYLLEQPDADLHAATEEGDTAMKLAIQHHGWRHELTRYVAKRVIEDRTTLDRNESQQSTLSSTTDLSETDASPVSYTAEDNASWAIKSENVSTILGEGPRKRYKQLLDQCRQDFENSLNASEHCEAQEAYRLFMNRYQPSSVYNYTQEGYAVTRVPDELFSQIQEFWQKNRHRSILEWSQPTTHHNNYASPTRTVNLRSQNRQLAQLVAETLHPLMEAWSGERLWSASVYGIRVYSNESILAPHVDRLPLIISAILCVDADVDEDWPLEVYGHAGGVARNVSLHPGDLFLYESHSILHGRPFPMNGRYYANMFLHWEVLGNGHRSKDDDDDSSLWLPPYLIAGSKMESDWKERNPQGWTRLSKDSVLNAVRRGDVRFLRHVHALSPPNESLLLVLCWKEAVRWGKEKVVEYLLECCKSDLWKNKSSWLEEVEAYLSSSSRTDSTHRSRTKKGGAVAMARMLQTLLEESRIGTTVVDDDDDDAIGSEL